MSILRSTNGVLAVICSILIYDVITHLKPTLSDRKATIYAVVLTLYPLHWFFTFLHYTDIASLTAVLATYLTSLKRKYWISALLSMAPLGKKYRYAIGSMQDAIAQNTQIQNDNHDNSDDSFSYTNSDNSSDDRAQDQLENSGDDDTNEQETITRGPAKLGFQWGTGKVMMLDLDANNEVVGNNAVHLSSQLGILAKDGNKLPISYTDWRAVPQMQKDMVWDDVKENTNLPDSYKKRCLQRLGKLWKDWKSRLKAKHYTPHRHNQTYILSKCPLRVETDQWPVLVNYWSTKKAKKVSKNNKTSRKNVKLPSRLGRKDTNSAKHEYRQQYGQEPSKPNLFIATRVGKSGKPLDKFTSEKIAILKEKMQKLPEGLRDDIQANDEIYEEVIGKDAPGCLRSSGLASKSKKLIFISREEFDQAVKDKANDQVASIQKGFEEQLSKFKDDMCSKMEMVQARFLPFEDQNTHVSGSSNSKRVLASNNGSSLQGFMNLENSSQANETLEMRKEINNADTNNTNIHSNGTSPKEQGKSPRRSKRKAK